MMKNIDNNKLERAARGKTVSHSYSGATVGQIEEKIEEHWNEDEHFDKIILHIGTNDLVSSKPSKVAENMERLIEKVKIHADKVAVSSVIKRYDNKVKATNITHYNDLLHKLCLKHKIDFIDNDTIDKPLLNRSINPITSTIPMTQDNYFRPAHKHQRRDWTIYLRYVNQVLNQ